MSDRSIDRALKGLMDRIEKMAGVTNDSRKVQKGFVFVAVRGTKEDGHRYIKEAIAKGAVAVVTSEPPRPEYGVPQIQVEDSRQALATLSARFYGDPSERMRVIGITGTNGKTTLTYLMESILVQSGGRPGILGTVNYRYGGKSLPAETTTPESSEIQRMMAEMRSGGVTDLVMEVSSHALDQGRVAGIHFDVAAFTNLTQDHLDYHESIAEYFSAKLKLFTEFLPASAKKGRFAVINMEDPRGEEIFAAVEKIKGLHPVRTGRTGPYEVSALSYQLSAEGIRATVMTQAGPIEIQSSLLGSFNLENILLAIGIAEALGLPREAIVQGVHALQGVPGRLERIPNKRGVQIYVDYAHTPDALSGVGETIRRLTQGRVITVFGCGGDRDKTKRSLMGAEVARFSDFVVVTSDNPRTEDPEKIIEEILPGLEESGFPAARIFKVVDRKKAIAKALGLARRGDLILIAGKGHEDYQIIGTTKTPFSDQTVVRELCENTDA